ncbi:amino acid ABC transporter substrate-binding protein (plasmid) [Pseudohalocynthiibacter aestuariivivens]|nr:transporter substrate-binding domain-containing protein [Pseudohalocynthiibacter aestuariivivens]QIE48011.1 amino acid ABC transporter substrate-binding protein [Pseudohalocynthiibacter aestuariivivens]
MTAQQDRNRTINPQLMARTKSGTILPFAGRRESTCSRARLAMGTAAIALASFTFPGYAGAEDIEVGLIAYAPFCKVAGDEPQGIEPEMLADVSERLDLNFEYSVSDFAGQLASVQAGRNDLAVCLFYWTEERAKRGVYTDPIMYAPIQVMQREGGNITSVKQMEGKTIGSITGYSWNPALQAVPGATVRLYPEYPALLADVASGRVDVAPADALVNDAAIKARPDWNLQISDLEVPTAEEIQSHPEYKLLRPSQIAWYLRKDRSELANELTAAINEMYADGSIASLLSKYGIEDTTVWLTPPGDYIAEERRGVDRPDDWQPPSVGN